MNLPSLYEAEKLVNEAKWDIQKAQMSLELNRLEEANQYAQKASSEINSAEKALEDAEWDVWITEIYDFLKALVNDFWPVIIGLFILVGISQLKKSSD